MWMQTEGRCSTESLRRAGPQEATLGWFILKILKSVRDGAGGNPQSAIIRLTNGSFWDGFLRRLRILRLSAKGIWSKKIFGLTTARENLHFKMICCQKLFTEAKSWQIINPVMENLEKEEK